MGMLEDGTVVPHYMGLQHRGHIQDTGVFSNTTLRIGEVKAIIRKTDDKSITGRFTEYNVEVQHRDGAGPGVATLYTNCLVMNLFGGVADVFRYTLRSDVQNDSDSGDGTNNNTQGDGVGVGAKVLVLCVNGDSTRAWIIGGVRDADNDKTDDVPDDGHNLFWEFNGIRQTVNKNGELTWLFRGATKIDGTLAEGVDKNKSGATFTFTKDGGIEIFDGGGGEESIKFDLGNHLIQINTDTNDGIVNISSPAGGLWKSKKTLTFDCDKCKIGSSDAAEALVLGSTYRDGESSMNDDLADGFQDLGQQIGELSTSITVAGSALSSGGSTMSAGLPGNIAAGPQVAAAGAALTEAVSTLSQMAQTVAKMYAAVKKFEASKDKYLSTHHTTES